MPSLPGYTFSSGPPVDRDFTSPDAARILNQVMVNLGFGNGYVAQGGDVGSKISRILGAKYDSCKGKWAQTESSPVGDKVNDD